MKTKFLYCLFALFAVNALFIGCKKELTVKPNTLVLTEDVFTDKNLILSVLARFYQNNTGGNGSNGGGQNNRDWNSFQQDPDDGVNNNGGPSTGNLSWSRDRYKTFDYGRIRELNQFLEGIRSDASKKAMTAGENTNFEAQAMFLRAYTFFNMVKTLGGLTIVEDKVFDYKPGDDITPYRLPRNSEADCYKYIIDQCDKIAAKFAEAGAQNANLGLNKTVNSAITNKWTALMLKARAAVYAASIAKYTPLRAPGNVKKDAKGTDVVGIPATMANEFYTTALAAAEDVIANSPYVLQTNAANPELAFYQATTIKAANTEVIWSTDRKSPSGAGNVAIHFTGDVGPFDKAHSDGQNTGNSLGPTLNLVEAFENRDGSDPKIKDFDANGNHIIYDDVEAPFKAKDARLWGTVIWPYAVYRGTPVPLRAGELRSFTRSNGGAGSYTYTVNAPSASRADGPEATGPNGPADVSTSSINKTGFNMRKWVDETPNSGIAPNWSEIWWPRFRLSEAYLIAAEAAFELGQTSLALTRINKIRTERGKITALTAGTLTFDKIVNENRVEFAFEDHRVWDLIRWRLAHVYWNGITDDPVAQAMELYPYRINIAGNPNNGKWVFRRARSYRRVTTPFYFDITSYYSTITQTWVNPNNPNWVGNPYQTF